MDDQEKADHADNTLSGPIYTATCSGGALYNSKKHPEIVDAGTWKRGSTDTVRRQLLEHGYRPRRTASGLPPLEVIVQLGSHMHFYISIGYLGTTSVGRVLLTVFTDEFRFNLYCLDRRSRVYRLPNERYAACNI